MGQPRSRPPNRSRPSRGKHPREDRHLRPARDGAPDARQGPQLTPHSTGEKVLARLLAATNAHDIDAFVGCFAEEYDSVQPAHPDRAFRGRDQVRANWSAIFNSVPDFRASIIRADAVGEVVWSEWCWEGTQGDGQRLDMAGVIVLGIRDECIAWARLYIEPVETAGAGIEAAVRDMTAER